MNCAIVHIDLDTFFVSCERLNNSKLNNITVIIGGGDRGLVSSCLYEARFIGVHSVMPIRMAIKLCPDAKIVRGDYELYSNLSHTVIEIFKRMLLSWKKRVSMNFTWIY